jgi:hypothetical protein
MKSPNYDPATGVIGEDSAREDGTASQPVPRNLDDVAHKVISSADRPALVAKRSGTN